tara:strand:- start:283 stop:792 length:510 start_codon:yes stop_codon:yes gene_type:complete
MKKITFILLSFNIIFAECTPLEVSVYISEKDGWMFPYSTFYWGMSDGLSEIQQYNDECYQLLENNNECIMECIAMEQEQLDYNLGRIGCIYYNCPDGELLTQNYEEHAERPSHLYGELYCDENTEWNATSDLCESNVCNGDLNQDSSKNISDIVIMVQDILNGLDSCEE